MNTQVTLDMNRISTYKTPQEQFESIDSETPRPNEKFRPHIARMIKKSIEDIKAGRNLSPALIM